MNTHLKPQENANALIYTLKTERPAEAPIKNLYFGPASDMFEMTRNVPTNNEANLNHNMFNGNDNPAPLPSAGVCSQSSRRRYLSKLFYPLTSARAFYCSIITLCIIFGMTSGMVKANPIEQDSILIKIWATDALGNSDTVYFSVNKEGIPALEEINLYGTPPQGDLDLRILFRSDSNYSLPGNP